MDKIKWWFVNKKMEWLYANEMDVSSIYYFWQCLKTWWRLRPIKIECANCHTKMWWNGNNGIHYCSEGCAYYGPSNKTLSRLDGISEDEIPF